MPLNFQGYRLFQELVLLIKRFVLSQTVKLCKVHTKSSRKCRKKSLLEIYMITSLCVLMKLIGIIPDIEASCISEFRCDIAAIIVIYLKCQFNAIFIRIYICIY